VDLGKIKRIRQIFEGALAQSSSVRREYVAEACGGDAELQHEVISLLNAHEQSHKLLDRLALGQLHPALPSSTDLPAGTVVAERFTIERLLGRGGMGQVYEATDAKLHRKTALKFLVHPGQTDPGAQLTLQREARALAALRHPNICAVYDVCSQPAGDFVVMEYLDGETLAARLHNRGPLSVPALVHISRQICSALQFAHERGILHRDLKPANIMLTPNGAKLLDFGIATFASLKENEIAGSPVRGDGAQPLTATVTGGPQLIGTPQYMSPEQALGQPLNAASDLFSFGAVMYELATGSRAFHGETPTELLNAILTEEPRTVRSLNSTMPVLLERAISRCLEKDPEHRYGSAAELGRALAEIETEPISDESLTNRTAHFRPGRRTAIWSVAAIVSLLVAITVYSSVDLRSAVRLHCTRFEAIQLAKRSVSDLGYSMDGFREKATFNPAVDFERVMARQGLQTAREIVRSGRGFAWEIEFTPDSAIAKGRNESGLSVRVGTSGSLLEFQGARSATVPPASEPLTKEARKVVDTFLNFSTMRPPDVLSRRGGHWTTLAGTSRWPEEVDVGIAGHQVYLLNRRVVSPDGPAIPDTTNSRGATHALYALTTYRAQVSLVLYCYGIWVFAKRRRFMSLPWRVPILLSVSGALGYGWAMSGASSSSKFCGPTFIIALLLLPSVFGLFLALRHKDEARVSTMERLLSARFRNPDVAAAIRNGVLAGGVLAGVGLSWPALQQASTSLPDMRYLTAGIMGDTPWRFGEVSIALMTGLITISVVTTLNVMKRFVRRTWLAILVTALVLAPCYVEVTERAFTDLFVGVAVIVCQLMIYRTSGLLAALCANFTSQLMIAGVVGVHLDNNRFLHGSLAMLAIPTVLLCAAALTLMMRRDRSDSIENH
jgi:serine/threonine protein kinase